MSPNGDLAVLGATNLRLIPTSALCHHVAQCHVQAEEARMTSGAEVIVFAPLVKADQKKDWEEYATKNQDWIRNGLDVSILYRSQCCRMICINERPFQSSL